MLDFLREWVLSLSGVAVFGSVCDVILPDGSFQKYIRLSVGILLVLTLMTPMQQLFHIIPKEEEMVLRHSRAYEEREGMETQEKEAVLHIYQENLNQKFLSSIKQRLGDGDMEVRCSVEEEDPEEFGTVKEVLVLFRDGDEINQTDEVAKVLKQDYGIPAEKVVVRYLKERNG